MTARQRRSGERGIATIWSVIVVSACVAMVGLVLDGGVILRARSEAFSVAGTAARVGAQELDSDAAAQGDVILDPTRARQAATDYLDARDVTGTVTVTGNQVTVAVTVTADLQILRVANGGTVDVSSTATVSAIKGPTP